MNGPGRPGGASRAVEVDLHPEPLVIRDRHRVSTASNAAGVAASPRTRTRSTRTQADPPRGFGTIVSRPSRDGQRGTEQAPAGLRGSQRTWKGRGTRKRSTRPPVPVPSRVCRAFRPPSPSVPGRASGTRRFAKGGGRKARDNAPTPRGRVRGGRDRQADRHRSPASVDRRTSGGHSRSSPAQVPAEHRAQFLVMWGVEVFQGGPNAGGSHDDPPRGVAPRISSCLRARAQEPLNAVHDSLSVSDDFLKQDDVNPVAVELLVQKP